MYTYIYIYYIFICSIHAERKIHLYTEMLNPNIGYPRLPEDLEVSLPRLPPT